MVAISGLIILVTYHLVQFTVPHIDGLVQERCNSIANALELCLSCTKSSIWRLGTFRFHLQVLFYKWVTVTLLDLSHWGKDRTVANFPDILKCIFLNENIWISIKILPKLVSKVPINNIPSLVHIMAWCQLGDKSLSEPTMASLLMCICTTQPQSLNNIKNLSLYVIKYQVYLT